MEKYLSDTPIAQQQKHAKIPRGSKLWLKWFIYVCPIRIMALTILKCVQILTIAIYKYDTQSLSLIVAIIVLSKKLIILFRPILCCRKSIYFYVYYIYSKHSYPLIQVLDRVMYSTLEYVS
jgi:hypothetical protein